MPPPPIIDDYFRACLNTLFERVSRGDWCKAGLCSHGECVAFRKPARALTRAGPSGGGEKEDGWPREPDPSSLAEAHLNRAKNFVAVAEPQLRGATKCAWAWLRRACPYSDSDFDLENYGLNHAESPPPRASKAKGKKSRGASSRRST